MNIRYYFLVYFSLDIYFQEGHWFFSHIYVFEIYVYTYEASEVRPFTPLYRIYWVWMWRLRIMCLIGNLTVKHIKHYKYVYSNFYHCLSYGTYISFRSLRWWKIGKINKFNWIYSVISASYRFLKFTYHLFNVKCHGKIRIMILMLIWEVYSLMKFLEC